MKIPTVQIDVGGSPVTINKSDFDEESHKLWDPKKPAPEVKEPEVKPEAKAIHKGGGKWVVMVGDKQINDEFLSKAEAKALVAEQ